MSALKFQDYPTERLFINSIRSRLTPAENRFRDAIMDGIINTGQPFNPRSLVLEGISNPGALLDRLIGKRVDKLGTPFVTTRYKGTGLGLAVCYSIAARHKAKIDYQTGSEGTTFNIRFPIPTEPLALV
ncbi:MAG: ATP-binding protein [Syntrophomonas sp.]